MKSTEVKEWHHDPASHRLNGAALRVNETNEINALKADEQILFCFTMEISARWTQDWKR